MKKHVYVIAEAGVNHNGKIELAEKMIWQAKEAGADAIKFQTFKTDALISKFAPKAQYQERETDANESQRDMLKKLELSYDEFCFLKKVADKAEITFISTPFDLESIGFLDSLGMPLWKIPSGEITNLPYLECIAATQKPIILSTGMCNLQEIEESLEVLIRKGISRDNITLLHCTTEYPAPLEDVNLKVMDTFKARFGTRVGYSDHTSGIVIAVAAVAHGAEVLEKHFTLDKNLEGPDHKASLDPDELKKMIKAIREVELCLGDGEKRPSEAEMQNRIAARKSIVAKRKICQGELLTEENVAVKRPGNGLSPMRWYTVLGTQAVRDFEEDELIEQ